MTFEEILDQVMAMLQRRGRLTYGTVKRQFQLDDAALEDLQNEFIYGQRLAVDEEEGVLVWRGEPASAPPPTPAPPPARGPLAYTPAHLAEKIVTSRSALEGERKQIVVENKPPRAVSPGRTRAALAGIPCVGSCARQDTWHASRTRKPGMKMRCIKFPSALLHQDREGILPKPWQLLLR
jgi:hypothetical protein